MSENSSSGPSPTILILGVASISAGAYHGFCDAQGIPLPREMLEVALTYGPAAVQGGIGGLVGIVGGTYTKGGYTRKAGGVLGKSLAGAAVNGTLGALETLLGYGIGYAAGYLAR